MSQAECGTFRHLVPQSHRGKRKFSTETKAQETNLPQSSQAPTAELDTRGPDLRLGILEIGTLESVIQVS